MFPQLQGNQLIESAKGKSPQQLEQIAANSSELIGLKQINSASYRADWLCLYTKFSILKGELTND